MNKLPYTHFDLPRQHLIGAEHYLPARTRDSDEAERRRRLPAGTVLAEQQARGLKVAHRILESVHDHRDIAFTSQLVASAAINSSWYTFAKDAPDVMRRRLYLPKMADHETDWRQSHEGLRQVTLDSLATTAVAATVLAEGSAHNRVTDAQLRSFGRNFGSTALKLALLGSPGVPTGHAFEVQRQVRHTALDSLEQARQSSQALGSHASIAQLADPDSPLAVYFRREAPNGAFQAYEAATEAV